MNAISRKNSEAGTQIVEMAIVLPLLCLLVFFVVSGSDLVRAHNVLNNAAREGARLIVQEENSACGETTNSNYSSCVSSIVSAVKAYSCFEQGGIWAAGVCTPNKHKVLLINPANMSVAIAHSQVPDGTGAVMNISTVSVTYPYTLFANFSTVSNTQTLQAKASFRNMY